MGFYLFEIKFFLTRFNPPIISLYGSRTGPGRELPIETILTSLNG